MKAIAKRASVALAATCALTMTTVVAGPAAFAEEVEVIANNSSAASNAQPAAQTCTDVPGELVLNTGFVEWGILKRFTEYVENPNHAAGEITVNGVERVQKTPALKVFKFTATSGEFAAARHGGEFAFGGSIRFTGRGGQMDSTLSNLKLVIANRQAHFHADIKGLVWGGGTFDEKNVAIAKVDLSGHRHDGPNNVNTYFTDAPVTLTEEGRKLFGSAYPAGQVMDTASGELRMRQKQNCVTTPPIQGGDQTQGNQNQGGDQTQGNQNQGGDQTQGNQNAGTANQGQQGQPAGDGTKPKGDDTKGKDVTADKGKDKNPKATNPKDGVAKTTQKPGLAKTGATAQALIALSVMALAAGLLARRRTA